MSSVDPAFAAAPRQSLDLGYGLLWFAFALSGLVFIEPAPFDFAIIGLGLVFFLMGLRLPGSLAPFLALNVMVVVGGLVALGGTGYLAESARHLMITVYLAFIAVVVAAVVYNDPPRALTAILGGQAIAALLSALLGAAGYFEVFAGAHEMFTLFGRASGAFKDPNVFGPFLVMGAIYALYHVITRPLSRILPWLVLLAVISFGILLSFSRGAWGHFVISAVMCIALLLLSSHDRNMGARVVLMGVAALVAGGLAILAALNVDAIARMFEIRGEIVQAYDVGGRGRFDGQALALDWVFSNPFGVGQNDFGVFWGEQPHNVYLYMLLQTGWLGGLAYLALVLGAVAGGFRLVAAACPWRGFAIVLTSVFLGLALEGLLVDTDHWRHFWVLVGALWGLIAWQRDHPALRDPSSPGGVAP